jgi:Domain of unknown function (DUF1707)
MAGTPAPGRPRSLITEAGRERVVARLREHYARGEFELDELRRRVEVVLAATYLDEADAAVADLPQVAGPAAGPPAPGPAPRPRRRGHAQAARPGAGWVRTGERFRDPTSKVIMRVWVDPSTDPETRHYLPDSE